MSKKQSKNVVHSSKEAIEQMKYEIASELGIHMGPNTASRLNGYVGGEITKRLVDLGEKNLKGKRK